MKAWLWLAGGLCLSLPLLAADEPRQPDLVAKPALIVSPLYPPGVPLDHPPVEIRVRGTIGADGRFVSPSFTNTADDEAFAQAVRDVLKFWRFVPEADGTACKPKDSPAELHVWFEMKDGKPAISVSMPAKEAAAPQESPLHFDTRPYVLYPRGAQRATVEGETILLVNVHKSGEIRAVNVRSPAILPVFDTAALEGFKGASLVAFDPKDVGGKEMVCVEYVVQFCLTGWGRTAVKNPKCKEGW